VALEKSKCIGAQIHKSQRGVCAIICKKKEKQKIEKAEKEKVAALGLRLRLVFKDSA